MIPLITFSCSRVQLPDPAPACAGWQKPDVRPTVARDPARQKKAVLLCVGQEKHHHMLHTADGEGVLWQAVLVPMDPRTESVEEKPSGHVLQPLFPHAMEESKHPLADGLVQVHILHRYPLPFTRSGLVPVEAGSHAGGVTKCQHFTHEGYV